GVGGIRIIGPGERYGPVERGGGQGSGHIGRQARARSIGGASCDQNQKDRRPPAPHTGAPERDARRFGRSRATRTGGPGRPRPTSPVEWLVPPVHGGGHTISRTWPDCSRT